MSIRDFNREYSTIGVGKCNLTPDEAMQLHCLMVVSETVIYFYVKKRSFLNFVSIYIASVPYVI